MGLYIHGAFYFFVYKLFMVILSVCFFPWVYGQEGTVENSSLATDSADPPLNRSSDSSSDNMISAQYSLTGTVIAAVLAAGVGIYSAISNRKL